MAKKLPEHYFELYKIAVDMADKMSARRGTANTFFITVHGALASLLGIIIKDTQATDRIEVVLLFLACIGIVLSATWFLMIKSYRDYNTAKFNVITEMERQLPAKIFTDEWRTLKKDPVPWWRKRFAELTSVEKFVPGLFAAAYIFIIGIVVIGKI